MNTTKIKGLSVRSYCILFVYILFAAISFYICLLPLFAELAYRKAHLYSNEAKAFNYKYISRYPYAFSEFKKAIRLFPFETHYSMEYLKELENFSSKVKQTPIKIKALKEILEILNFMQYIDPINPWFHSRRSIVSTKLHSLTQDPAFLTESIYRNKISAFIDYENPIFLLNYANLLHSNNRYSESFYYYKKALSIDSRFPESHFNLAHLYYKFNKLDDSIRHYNIVKKLNPNFRNIDAVIIKHYIAIGDLKKGHSYILKHELYHSKNIRTLESILFFYFQKKNYNTVLSYFPLYLKQLNKTSTAPNASVTKLYSLSYLDVHGKKAAITELQRLMTQFPSLSHNESLKTLFP